MPTLFETMSVTRVYMHVVVWDLFTNGIPFSRVEFDPLHKIYSTQDGDTGSVRCTICSYITRLSPVFMEPAVV